MQYREQQPDEKETVSKHGVLCINDSYFGMVVRTLRGSSVDPKANGVVRSVEDGHDREQLLGPTKEE